MCPEMIQKSADATFALIVGIEKYDLGDDWTQGVKGSVASALEFFDWLTRKNCVRLDNVFLHLSPQNSHAAARPADLASLRGSIQELRNKKGEALYIFWAGHGYARETERRLYVADSGFQSQTLSFDALLAFLGAEPIGLQRQLAFVDACAVTTVSRSYQFPPYRFAEDPVDIAAEQFAHFACRIGEAALYEGNGCFSRAVLDAFSDQTLPLDLKKLDEGLGDKFDKLKAEGQRPMRYWARNPRGEKKWDSGLDERWRSLVAVYPLPQVATVNPYEELHLTKGEVGSQYDFIENYPPYVPRELDVRLDKELGTAGGKFIVLLGASKAGKSRTAFEALVRNCSDLWLVIPDKFRDLREILERYEDLVTENGHAVLWLDNLHVYLNSETISPGTLQRLIRKHGLVVVATMWDDEYRKIMELRSSADSLKNLSSEIYQSAQNVLAHAIIIRLESSMTAAELEAAKSAYPHMLFGPGIGESFVARERLIDRFTNGTLELKAIMNAAIDLRRTGVSQAVSVQILADLFKSYYRQEDPGAWMPGKEWEKLFEEGLSLAIKPIGRYQRLLNRDFNDTSDAFTAYDPLVYYVDNELKTTIPPGTWKTALNFPEVDLNSVGNVALKRGETDIAKEAWAKSLAQGNGGAALNLGRVLYQAGDEAGARAVYEKGMQLGEGEAAFCLGLLLVKTDDMASVRAAYKKAMELGEGQAAIQLGMALRDDGDAEGERASYEKGIELGCGEAAVRLGKLLKEAGDTAGERAAYEKGMELGYGEAIVRLGQLLNEAGDAAGERAAYEKGVELGCGEAAVHLGGLLEEAGDKAGGRTAYEKGIELGCGEAAVRLGLLLKKMGDGAGAQAAYVKGIALGRGESIVHLGALFEEAGSLAVAQGLYKEGIKVGIGEAAVPLGLLLKLLGDVAGERAAYEKGVELNDSDAACHLAFLLAQEGNVGGARSVIIKVAKRRVAAPSMILASLMERCTDEVLIEFLSNTVAAKTKNTRTKIGEFQ